jgi:cell wall-associated NlpC family hydrolase
LKNREFGKEEAQIFVSGASDIAYGQDATDSSGCFGITPGKKALCPPMPSKELILERMERRIGTPYIWGGNWGAGIPELIHYYPPKGEIDLLTQQLWILQGVDCSGLLYEATRGATPRNTSSLIYYGKQLNNNDLQPLDMVVYPGHVFFVLDSHTAIESRLGRGVIRSDLKARMEELRQTRTQVPEWKPDLDPAKHFVIRRL